MIVTRTGGLQKIVINVNPRRKEKKTPNKEKKTLVLVMSNSGKQRTLRNVSHKKKVKR